MFSYNYFVLNGTCSIVDIFHNHDRHNVPQDTCFVYSAKLVKTSDVQVH